MNSELSYEAELSCLSKSSISLAREEKNSAIFGSQQTTTLDRNLVSVKWRHRLISQLVSVLSFSTRVFFSNGLAYFFDSNFKILTRVFFLFVNIYFANLDSCFLLHSMYFTRFGLSIMFSTCFYYRYNLSATERHRHDLYIKKSDQFSSIQINKSKWNHFSPPRTVTSSYNYAAPKKDEKVNLFLRFTLYIV